MRRQSKRRFNQFLRQYPALQLLVSRAKEDALSVPEHHTITVERADTSTLYRFGESYAFPTWRGGGYYTTREDGCISATEQYGCSVIGGRIARYVMFPRRNEHYFHHVLIGSDHDLIGAIVWVRRDLWYEEADNSKVTSEAEFCPHGELREVEVHYTVYLPPEQGFSELKLQANLLNNVELTEQLLIRLALTKHPASEPLDHALWDLAKHFEREVYATGMKEAIQASDQRGMTSVYGGVTVMSWVMCGRVMLTLNAPNPRRPQLTDSVTFIGNEPPAEVEFGFRSIYATMDRASELVTKVATAWNALSPSERSASYVNDRMVRLAGMPPPAEEAAQPEPVTA